MPKEIARPTITKKNKSKKPPKLPLLESTKLHKEEVTKGNELAVIDTLNQDYDWIRPIVQVRGVSLIRNKRVILNDIFFEVKKGQIFGIAGEDDSKDTILKIISLQTAKTNGKILLDGLDIDTYKAQVKNLVAFNPKKNHLVQILNLKQTLQWLAFNYKTKIKVQTILELTKLENAAKLKPKELDLLQKSLWNIARGLITNFPIILLDQPLDKLNSDQANTFKTVLHTIKRSGKTLVITSNQISILADICDAYLRLDRGKVFKTNQQ